MTWNKMVVFSLGSTSAKMQTVHVSSLVQKDAAREVFARGDGQRNGRIARDEGDGGLWRWRDIEGDDAPGFTLPYTMLSTLFAMTLASVIPASELKQYPLPSKHSVFLDVRVTYRGIPEPSAATQTLPPQPKSSNTALGATSSPAGQGPKAAQLSANDDWPSKVREMNCEILIYSLFP